MELQETLRLHKLYLEGAEGGVRANLQGANLQGADLQGADLQWANLYGADLQWANLQGANLYGADLYGADLQRVDLQWANLQWAYLQGANLQEADLEGADLRKANLRGANLPNTKLPDFQICPQGVAFVGYKKIKTGVIKLMIPEHAQRTSSLVGRKCRASSVIVLEGPEGYDWHTGKTFYKVGEEVFPDQYDGDIRVECTNGIHFFMTEQEAEGY